MDLDGLRLEILSEQYIEKLVMEYPVIQGHHNQQAIKKIGEQKTNSDNIKIAIKWLLDNGSV